MPKYFPMTQRLIIKRKGGQKKARSLKHHLSTLPYRINAGVTMASSWLTNYTIYLYEVLVSALV